MWYLLINFSFIFITSNKHDSQTVGFHFYIVHELVKWSGGRSCCVGHMTVIQMYDQSVWHEVVTKHKSTLKQDRKDRSIIAGSMVNKNMYHERYSWRRINISLCICHCPILKQVKYLLHGITNKLYLHDKFHQKLTSMHKMLSCT